MTLLHNVKLLLVVFSKISISLLLVGLAYSDVSPSSNPSFDDAQGYDEAQGYDDGYANGAFYQALVAEFYQQSGQPKSTLQHYLPLALNSHNPVLLKRVTEIATGSGQLNKGLKVAQRWVKTSPEDIEAQQYLTLLLLRDNQLKAAAKQLFTIRQIVEDSLDGVAEASSKPHLLSEGLKFIGSLLVIEAHHDKAYQVFSLYLNDLNKNGPTPYGEQQNLILASLAMKAKKYAAVVSALDQVKQGKSQTFASAAIMKTKALRKLGKVSEAAQLLKSIVKNKKNSDSLQLELTRLLISSGKKQEASQLLSKLVSKHPDNFDLLKSLVALSISLQQLESAREHNQKLAKNPAYQSDANYFFGEIEIVDGQQKKALAYFKQVNSGKFRKKAHHKIARLMSQLQGLKAAKSWLHQQQKSAKKTLDKAHWLKVEAELIARENSSSRQTTLLKNDTIKNAIVIYSKIILLQPKKSLNFYRRGLLYERSQQAALAEKDFKQALKLKKNNADALNALGFLLLKSTARLDEASQFIQQAYRLKPNAPEVMDSMGWLSYRQGKTQRAVELLRKAFHLMKNPEIASHLITVLSQSGQHQEAQKIFKQMQKKYPDNATLSRLRATLKKL